MTKFAVVYFLFWNFNFFFGGGAGGEYQPRTFGGEKKYEKWKRKRGEM